MKKKIIILVIIYFVSCWKPYSINAYNHEKIPILMYHHLEKNVNNNVVISPENFESQIKSLKANGYNTITIQQLYDYLNGNIKLPKKPVLITFDDGYLSNYEMAYPILKKYNMHAEIFVITSRILEKNEKNTHSNEIPKMNWNQLREMKDYITIQSHSWDSHYKLTSGNDKQYSALYGPSYINGKLEKQEEFEERVKNDFIRSRKIIKEKLGYEPIAISYPFGSKSEATLKLAKAAGFKLGFVIKNKNATLGDNQYALSRITVNGNDTGTELINKLISDD
ncbi:polysaccharide deacetylase family protein [Lysinibacillus agricola]|uniref:Polysaccharide deacetylase family protein n=1 Tax=Lysinibacillus agricola TaxID=2590012 RepID=A0ABX7ANA7_9BACI|nr:MULTISPECIES: polysaccharide deacetylase family protein [Lysinibacillus]KOS61033.1 chitin deacetylase [Lysinibacillus sp. FJAT-14222]QQP11413.1 polysaccharide deacetylase family protein [Lysinibacillus agricola]